ncbi:VanZ family protein [Enterococcus faecium]|uniref:VanZ family protein n=1 Tax=Enterococcus faecium TaxID=1352 RepID=UPI0028866B20|nr:VanZ family protein [Enterococcus faecium]MDT0236263.1 VanZ family protein [Enterococcus faecium]MDT0242465.1 VanZ family protein [Enterococcus faecium]MDT0244497.1 VanZ family protein [Enterococcus faecium]HAP7599686.1 VanZ family protein [Enterococcus faecium]HAP7602738.1 VanZ family protein [Enterococcus faecium]
MRYVSKFLLGIYLFFLLWVILFKLSFNLPQFLTYSYSNVNLVPFSTFSFENTTVLRETTYNLIVFFPFGVLLNVNFKRLSFSKKLGIIFLVSFLAELIQFLFGIGVADITDLITNTTGGLIGLWAYQLLNKHLSTNKLDRLAIILGYILFLFLIVAFLFLTRTVRLQ